MKLFSHWAKITSKEVRTVITHFLMKIASSIRKRVGRLKLVIEKTALSIVLLITVLSGCSSAISNSERFYNDRPRRPINWREYMSD